MSKKQKEAPKLFQHQPVGKDKLKEHLDVDLASLYQQATQEMTLQQTKRDQIISLYLAIFSFLIPFALGQESLSLRIKGLIFLITGMVGILFGLIIIRYRIYKEAYWLCCQCITVLSGIKTEALNKSVVQNAYYETLYKKGKGFFKDGTEKFSRLKYVHKNLFSAETLYFMIHALITSIILALGTFLFAKQISVLSTRYIVAGAVGLACAAWLTWRYFHECIKVYQVLIDHTDAAFNSTFKKAWFLHFYAYRLLRSKRPVR